MCGELVNIMKLFGQFKILYVCICKKASELKTDSVKNEASLSYSVFYFLL